MAKTSFNNTTKATSANTTTDKKWNSVSGYCTVFGREFENNGKTRWVFSTSLYGKKADSEDYDTLFIPVSFEKGCGEFELEDGKAEIFIDEGFISVNTYTKRDGTIVTEPKLVVMKCH